MMLCKTRFADASSFVYVPDIPADNKRLPSTPKQHCVKHAGSARPNDRM
jgi:hypothetical protein